MQYIEYVYVCVSLCDCVCVRVWVCMCVSSRVNTLRPVTTTVFCNQNCHK